MPPLIVRLTRIAGWIALAASCGVVVGTVVYQSAGGLVNGQHLWPTPRLWRYFITTLWMSAGSTIMALGLAIPVAYTLLRVPHPWQKKCLVSLMLIPLFTMPSVFAYAWFILAAYLNPMIYGVWHFVGLHPPATESLFAACVLATWLWPIPALVLATSFKHVGAGAYHLASLDTSSRRAFFTVALPVMRGPLIAACAMIFILAATDSTVSPLLGASSIWSVELLASAGIAMRFARPAAFLFWQSWPMLATIAVLILIALPGIRQMAGWADETDTDGEGQLLSQRPWIANIYILIIGCLAVFPIVVFGIAMSGGRYTIAQSFQAAARTLLAAGWDTLIVAVCSAAFAAAMGLTVLDDSNCPKILRWIGLGIVAMVLLVAVLPPPMIGTSLVSFYSNPTLSPPDRWNLYDNLPITWIAAMLARYAFLPVCLMSLLNRRIPQNITGQCALDGANHIQRITFIRIPLLWRALLASAFAVACMTMGDVTASGLVQPPQWGNGSLAVYVDSQMHYGRHNHTIALSIIMILPGVLAALFWSLVPRWRLRLPSPDALNDRSAMFVERENK